jgi:thiol-disulfide isomerase/thioredoxin
MKKQIRIILIAAGLLTAGFGFLNCKTKDVNTGTLPDSELVDANNTPLNFTQFKGKIVVINNWASWCPPCIAEMPSIQNLKNNLKNEHIVFVMVSYDDTPEKALRFMQKKNFDFEIYFPGKKYPFHTESIPATFVLDKTGKVIAVHNGMANFDTPKVLGKFKSLLK